MQQEQSQQNALVRLADFILKKKDEIISLEIEFSKNNNAVFMIIFISIKNVIICFQFLLLKLDNQDQKSKK